VRAAGEVTCFASLIAAGLLLQENIAACEKVLDEDTLNKIDAIHLRRSEYHFTALLCCLKLY
jgi:hypothetical protein